MIGVFEAISPDEPWMDSAACASVGGDSWYPEKGGSTGKAKKICFVCPVCEECLAYALNRDERFGIWGGHSERERRRLKRGIFPARYRGVA